MAIKGELLSTGQKVERKSDERIQKKGNQIREKAGKGILKL